jgi:hypothetical protein
MEGTERHGTTGNSLLARLPVECEEYLLVITNRRSRHVFQPAVLCVTLHYLTNNYTLAPLVPQLSVLGDALVDALCERVGLEGGNHIIAWCHVLALLATVASAIRGFLYFGTFDVDFDGDGRWIVRGV